MLARREDTGEEYALAEEPLGRGGEAAVYEVVGRPDLVAKIFFQGDAERADKLAAMIVASPPTRSRDGHITLAWPTARLLGVEGRIENPSYNQAAPVGRIFNPSGIVGYVMPRVDTAEPIREYYHPAARRRRCPLFHYGYLLRTSRNLAAAVATLHDAGFIIGDLNEANVLVTSQATVTLVDTDSFQVRTVDRLFRCPVGKPEYTPPQLQGAFFGDLERTAPHDLFALAVLIFQLLMQGVHPFSGVYCGDGEAPSPAERIARGHWPYAWDRAGPARPAPHAPPWWVLPPAVQELFSRCFEDGHASPELRPSAREWQTALEEAEHELTVCALNGQHLFSRGLDVCPWCLFEQEHDCDPFPSREELKKRRARARAVQAVSRAAPTPERREAPSGPIREDIMPPPPAAAAVPRSSLVERAVCGLGAVMMRQPWSVWIAVGALAALFGVFATLGMHGPLAR